MVKIKLQSILLLAVLVASTGNAAELLSVNFESMTNNLQPTADDIRPVVNEPDSFIIVVDGVTNQAGTGKGIQIYDNSQAVATRVGYDFSTGESAIRFDFRTAGLANDGTSGEYIIAGVVANGMSVGTGDNRYAEMRVYANGEARFYSAGSYILGSSIDIGTNTSYKFTLYVNDSDEELTNYNGPRTLAPNSVDFWVNDAYYISGALNPAPNTTTAGLGRIGFASSTLDDKLNYTFDDLVVSNVTSGAAVDYILSESFEVGQTIGSLPNGATCVRPRVAEVTDVNFCKVTNGAINQAGSGNCAQLFDNNPSSSNTALEYELFSDGDDQVSAARIDFDIAYVTINTNAAEKWLKFGVGRWYGDGNQLRVNSDSKRWLRLQFSNHGRVTLKNNMDNPTNYPDSETFDLLEGQNKMSLFVNDYDAQSVEYSGLDGNVYTLPANSAAWWANSNLMIMEDDVSEYMSLHLDAATAGGVISNSINNIGRIGWYSGTSEYEINYVVDNIYVTTNILLVIDSWEEWVEQYQPALGVYTNYTDDYPDGDGLDNLGECALGGDPTVDDADDVLPQYHSSVEGGTNWLNYVYNRRVFRDGFPLTYYVGSSTTLQIPRNTPTEEAGVGVVDGLWESVTNRVSTDTLGEQFIQLRVQID